MSRTPDEQRPEQLRDAIIRYLVQHGLTGMSLRPLAKAVGSSPRGLLYHFGSKEKMVVKVLAELRQLQRAEYGGIDEPTFAEACRQAWKRMSAPQSVPLFSLFFEAYGMALRQPKLYRDFLRPTVEDWLQLIAEPLQQEGYSRREARAFATVVLAGLRGFLLDYCNTRDRKRLDNAVELWLSQIDNMLPKRKKTTK